MASPASAEFMLRAAATPTIKTIATRTGTERDHSLYAPQGVVADGLLMRPT